MDVLVVVGRGEEFRLMCRLHLMMIMMRGHHRMRMMRRRILLVVLVREVEVLRGVGIVLGLVLEILKGRNEWVLRLLAKMMMRGTTVLVVLVVSLRSVPVSRLCPLSRRGCDCVCITGARGERERDKVRENTGQTYFTP